MKSIYVKTSEMRVIRGLKYLFLIEFYTISKFLFNIKGRFMLGNFLTRMIISSMIAVFLLNGCGVKKYCSKNLD